MGTAVLVCTLSQWRGTAALYRVDPPVQFAEKAAPGEDMFSCLTYYVSVSAVDVPFSGPETYIFAADKNGDALSWGELAGSFQGGMDHAKALAGAGYTIVEEN